MSSTTATMEDCVKAAETFAHTVTRITGYDIESGSEIGRPCFRYFGLTDDIREEFEAAMNLMATGKLRECLQALREVTHHLDNKRGAYLKTTIIPTLTEFPYSLSVRYVKDEKIERVRDLVRQFDKKYLVGIVDLDAASRDFWEIFDLCEILKEEKDKEVADESRRALEKAERANEVHVTRCRETANQIRERFSFLRVA